MLFRGTFVGAASGAIGSAVASHNKGGQYLRARTVPSGKIPTPEQSAVRNALSSLSAAWSGSLTEEQRLAWGTYALNVPGRNALGDAIQLSGQNWYIACNTPRLQFGLARVDDAPVIFDRGSISMSPEILELSDTSGTLSLNGGGTITAAGRMMLFGGRAFNAGRNKYYGSFRATTIFAIGGGSSGQVFTPAFPIGSSVNQMTFTVSVTYDDGRLSTPFRFTFPG